MKPSNQDIRSDVNSIGSYNSFREQIIEKKSNDQTDLSAISLGQRRSSDYF